jgi:Ca-activated chloride channel family protein
MLLRGLALVLIVIAFARPQAGRGHREILTEGIDIVLTIDVSSSMEAQDLDKRKTRLDVCKEVVADFIRSRESDRIGMVVFAGTSFTECPLTLDYDVLLAFLDHIKIGMMEDGTAIGMGVATSLNRLSASKAKSRVIILLTDGVNNRGEIDPITAARMAAALGVKIYTIGAGSEGTVMQKVDSIFGPRYVQVPVEIDEKTLKQIAFVTGGRYFRATSGEKLEEVYREIGKLEKMQVKTREYVTYNDLFHLVLWPAMGLVVLEVVLTTTKLRTVP